MAEANTGGQDVQGCSGREAAWNAYLRRVAEGDNSALAALYDETSTLVYSIARSILVNTADAEEITLDVYKYVWRSAATYDSTRGTVATWLTMLARSRSLARLRTVSTARTNGISDIANEVWNTSVLGRTVLDGDQRILVERALQQLPDELRDLVRLSFFSGLSHPEIASRLNIPLGTVKGRIRTAISRLRDLIGQRNA